MASDDASTQSDVFWELLVFVIYLYEVMMRMPD